jgi:glycosyltransferase involved in cell wall biosynthesis
MVVVEALACGTPVIASRHTPWKILEDAGAGLWVDNSPESLAAALRAIMGDATVARTMSEAAPRLAARYQWSSVGQDMTRLYETVLRGETSSGIHED